MTRLLSCLLALLAIAAGTKDYAAHLVPLIDPAKLATLRERGAEENKQGERSSQNDRDCWGF